MVPDPLCRTLDSFGCLARLTALVLAKYFSLLSVPPSIFFCRASRFTQLTSGPGLFSRYLSYLFTDLLSFLRSSTFTHFCLFFLVVDWLLELEIFPVFLR